MEKDVGRELYERGWRQGCVIPLTPTHTYYKTVVPPVVKTIELAGEATLVLATQDCDLVKPDERLPFVEAIAATRDADLANEVQVNDGRYFVLDPEASLVADRVYHTEIAKRALLALPSPEAPCGGDETRGRRFAKWLGVRYDRIPLPDEAVTHLQRPLASAFHRLCRSGKALEQLNRDLREVRVIGDISQAPPFDVVLIYVLTEEASIETASAMIAEVMATAGFSVAGVPDESASVRVHRWHALPPSLLTVKAYHDSVPVSLERLSLRGEEIIGASALHADSA